MSVWLIWRGMLDWKNCKTKVIININKKRQMLMRNGREKVRSHLTMRRGRRTQMFSQMDSIKKRSRQKSLMFNQGLNVRKLNLPLLESHYFFKKKWNCVDTEMKKTFEKPSSFLKSINELTRNERTVFNYLENQG